MLLSSNLVGVSLLADHCIILVVAVVGISESKKRYKIFFDNNNAHCALHREEDVSLLPELAVWPELKLEELVSELALVSDIVAQVEVVGHVDANLQILSQTIM